MSKTKRTAMVKIKDLKVNLFVRKELDHDRVLFFALILENGGDLPPIKLTEGLAVIDGRHRLEAYELNDRTEIEAEIVECESEVDLIAIAYKSNTGGALPPTQADTEHTITLLLDRGVAMRRIGEVLGLPAGIARKYVGVVKSKIVRQKLSQASMAVADNGMTVAKAAEEYGVEPEKLKEIITGNRKKQKGGVAEVQRTLTKTHKSLSLKNAAAIKSMIDKLEDGDVSLKQVDEILTHIEQLQKRAARAVSQWRKRVEVKFPQLVEPSKKR